MIGLGDTGRDLLEISDLQLVAEKKIQDNLGQLKVVFPTHVGVFLLGKFSVVVISPTDYS